MRTPARRQSSVRRLCGLWHEGLGQEIVDRHILCPDLKIECRLAVVDGGDTIHSCGCITASSPHIRETKLTFGDVHSPGQMVQ